MVKMERIYYLKKIKNWKWGEYSQDIDVRSSFLLRRDIPNDSWRIIYMGFALFGIEPATSYIVRLCTLLSLSISDWFASDKDISSIDKTVKPITTIPNLIEWYIDRICVVV